MADTYTRAVFWLKTVHGITDVSPDDLKVSGETQEIFVWNFPGIPRPTKAELERDVPDETYVAAVKEAERAKYEQVRDSIIRTDPKFALVNIAVKKLCLTKLGMTAQEYGTFEKEVWDLWVDAKNI